MDPHIITSKKLVNGRYTLGAFKRGLRSGHQGHPGMFVQTEFELQGGGGGLLKSNVLSFLKH